MCGIVGFWNRQEDAVGLGQTVLNMLNALDCRGPDSAGVALYGEGQDGRLVLRVSLGKSADYEATARRVVARAEAFGIEAHQVDGQDVLAVNKCATELAERCRGGEGPFFMELETYRYHGHHVGDINRDYYRSKEEEARWKADRDPIVNFGKWLQSEGVATKEELAVIGSEIGDEAAAAVEYALAAPYPDAIEVDMHLFKGVEHALPYMSGARQ